MKTDEEESANEEQHHQARPYPRSATMSRVKGRRRLRPRSVLTASLTSTSGVSSTGSLETDTSETSSRTPDIFFIYNDGQKRQTGRQPTGQFTRRRGGGGKSAALFASTKGNCRLSLSELGSPKSGKFSHTTSVTSVSSDYLKHSNLDVRDLSFQERLRIARVHYFTISNAARLLLIAVCLGWFLYNATTILSDYSDYETQVYMEYRPPERTLPPAISICSYGSNLLQNLSVLEAVSVPIGSEGQPGDSLSLFANNSLSMVDMRIRCRYHTTTVSNVNGSILDCADLVPVVVSIQEGMRCYTFMSDIYGQMSRANQSNGGQFQLQFELFPQFRIELNGSLLSESWGNDEFPDEALTDSRNALGKRSGKVFLTLHDPKLLPDMQDIPLHQIMSGDSTRMVDIRFEKTVEVLLQPPYNTRCYPYDALQEGTPDIDPDEWSSLWYIDLYQYRSTGECILYCLWNYLKGAKCLNPNSIFTFELANASETVRRGQLSPSDADVSLQFCNASKESSLWYVSVKQRCLQMCRTDCRVETFNMDANIIEYEGVPEAHTAVIDITWSPESFTYIEHKEKMGSTEMMGELGGHIHIWLGISVITVIRYLINLVKTGDILPSTSCCCMLLWWRALLPQSKSTSN